MNKNEGRTLWISIGVAIFAVFLLYSWSQEQRDAVQRKFGNGRAVVVATKDIVEMATIDESMLEVVNKPEEFLQPEAVTEPESIIGQVAAVPFKKGEQILHTKLLLAGPETGLSFEVSPQKRAITIPIDDMRGVSKLLRPGDRIDLMAVIDSGKGQDQKREVKLLMQNVSVLAAGLNIAHQLPRRRELDANGKDINVTNLNASTAFNNITIEGSPEEVQKLIFILSTSPGNLFAVLRNPNDNEQRQVPNVSLEDVLQRSLRTPSSAPNPNPAIRPGGF